MCGLVGVAGRITAQHETVFKQLLIVDSLRGAHSVGIGSINAAGQTTLVKRACLPHDFLELKKVDDIFRQQNRCLIGHNRFATQGAINSVNAHPFDFEHIIGAHNGSLRFTHNLPDHKNFTVDSENIFHAINLDGSIETAKKLAGPYALTWWDKRDNTLHFLRNSERTLSYVFSADRQAIFWASELWMLIGVLQRNNLKYTEPVNVEVHKEYTFTIPLAGEAEITAIRVEDRDFYMPPVTSYSPYNSGYGGNTSSRGYHRPDSYTTGSGGLVGGAVQTTRNQGVLGPKKPNPLTVVVGGGKQSCDPLVTAALLRSRLKGLSDAKLMASLSTKQVVTH